MMIRNEQKHWAASAVAVLISLGILSACGGSSDAVVGNTTTTTTTTTTVATPQTLTLAKIGGYVDGTEAAAEITAYDPVTKRLFVVNGALGTVDILDLTNPAAPTKINTITPASGAVNSVAIYNGVAAVAIQDAVKTNPGKVSFYRTSDLTLISSVTVGALPDMVAFTPDGKFVVVANEGEPDSYNNPTPGVTSIDPEGSISIIDVQSIAAPTVKTASFTAFNGQEATLRAAGVRIYGPNATVAQDMEPEYVTISADSKTAYVTLQENNAFAVVDIATNTVTAIRPLGFKDHNVAGFGMDTSRVDSATGTAEAKIVTVPVKGMYLPDAVASYAVGGTTYLVTANEGDSRQDWPGFAEETTVKTHCAAGLDPAAFPGFNVADLLTNARIGDLNITSLPNGGNTGKNGAGLCTELYAFGGRSFSIWNAATGARMFDSGDAFETRTAALAGTAGFDFRFNASNGNNTLDGRSRAKGPEPEGVTLATFGAKTFAFIGLERVGGVMVYDVTNPAAPTYVTYVNSRTATTGDRGPEGLTVVTAANSPNGKPLLIVGNETSGSVAIYEINLAY